MRTHIRLSMATASVFTTAALLYAAAPGPARAEQNTNPCDRVGPNQAFTHPAPAESGQFGFALAASGDLLLVGAPVGAAGGAAYLLDANTGALLRKLTNPTPEEGDGCGVSVAIDGTRAIVGAPYDSVGARSSGAVHIFDTTNGSLLRTIVNPSPAVFDWFGDAIAISGDRVLIGAPGDSEHGDSSGVAYIFDASTGARSLTLHKPTPGAYDWFGDSVAALGDLALISAPYTNTGAEAAGAAYLFNIATGALLKTINNPTPEYDENFGVAVALAPGRALITAPFDQSNPAGVGSAYVFDTDSGSLLQTLGNPSALEGEYFGEACAIFGGRALVGAPTDLNDPSTNPGRIQMFDTETGALLQSIANPSADGGDSFGRALVTVGGRVIAGSPAGLTSDQRVGALHEFTCRAVTEIILEALLGRAGSAPNMDHTGDGDIDISDLLASFPN